jgi:signal transduction histidine kinase
MGQRGGRVRALVAGVRRLDALLPALVAVVGTVELTTDDYDHVPAAVATFWLACALLVLRRAHPLAMPPGVLGCFALAGLLDVAVGDPASWIVPPVVACFAAGRYGPWPRTWRGHLPSLASVLAALAGEYAVLAVLTDFSPDALFGLIGTVVPWLLGRSLCRELDRSARLAAHAERLAVEREHDVAAAATAEREHIARELHDVLAHSLSVMVVQASLAEDLVSRDQAAARSAIREVQQCGRDALAETGRLLRLIRDDEDELGLRPERGFADLDALVDDFTRSGLAVTAVVDPSVGDDVPVGVQMSVYRIVQEALTNALKHAPGSPVDVRLGRYDGEVRLDVRNGPPAELAVVGTTGGHGLVGVRERVALFGGSLRHGATRDGGFLLSASLPLDQAAR